MSTKKMNIFVQTLTEGYVAKWGSGTKAISDSAGLRQYLDDLFRDCTNNFNDKAVKSFSLSIEVETNPPIAKSSEDLNLGDLT